MATTVRDSAARTRLVMISSEVKVDVVMGWTERLRRWFPLVAVAFLFAACSGGESEVGELPPGVFEGSPSVGLATPSASVSPSASAPAAADCPNEDAVAVDPARQVGSSLSADVDGDGAADDIHLAMDEAGGEGCAAFVVVELASSSVDAAPVWQVGSQGGLPAPRIQGFVDINDAGGEEIVVDEAVGASTQFVGAFIYTDGALQRVTISGGLESTSAPGTESLFPYGGSAGHVEAVDCASPGTVVISAATPASTQEGQGVYEIERRFYSFDGAVLERDDVETQQVPIARLSRFPEYASSPFGSC